jgi:hypothetical protein
MDDNRAQELRDAFDRLGDEHRLSLADVDFIPAVLGRSIGWSYASTDGILTSATAYDEPIMTAGDLRRVLATHPRTPETDAAGNGLIEGIAGGIGQAIFPLRREIALNRVRIRALLELLSANNPSIYKEYDERLREVVERDLMAMEYNLALEPTVFEQRFGEWVKDNQARHNAKLGEQAEQSSEAWDRMQERLNSRLADLTKDWDKSATG